MGNTIYGGLVYASVARHKATIYAEEMGYYTDGKLITWDNESDAYRHFTWNALMLQYIGENEARTLSNYHETYLWSKSKQDNEIWYKIPLSSIMDAHNKNVGLLYALEYSNLTTDELFLMALSDGSLITTLDEVKQRYNLSNSQIFFDSDTQTEYIYYCVPYDENLDAYIVKR